MKSRFTIPILFVVTLASCVTLNSLTQVPPELRELMDDQAAQLERIGRFEIDPDGAWTAMELLRADTLQITKQMMLLPSRIGNDWPLLVMHVDDLRSTIDEVRNALKEHDPEATRTAIAHVKDQCNACHKAYGGSYR